MSGNSIPTSRYPTVPDCDVNGLSVVGFPPNPRRRKGGIEPDPRKDQGNEMDVNWAFGDSHHPVASLPVDGLPL